jgi:hypothetical protein
MTCVYKTEDGLCEPTIVSDSGCAICCQECPDLKHCEDPCEGAER